MRFLPGQLHPVLVHFPVALLILAAGLVVASGFRPKERWWSTLRLLVVAGALGAVASSGAGWILAGGTFYTGHEADLLDVHALAAYGVTASAIVAAAVHLTAKAGQRRLYIAHVATVLAALGVSVVGYVGGELVHGENHLFAQPETVSTEPVLADLHAPTVEAPTTTGGEIVFRRDIRPLLKRSCFKCHSARKDEGGLRLDQRELALQGGDTGPAIVPGNPTDSLLIQRIQLPTDHDDYMPSKGDPLSDAEVARLVAWVEAGASYY